MRVDRMLVGHPPQLVPGADPGRPVQRHAVVDRLAQGLEAVQVVGHVHVRLARRARVEQVVPRGARAGRPRQQRAVGVQHRLVDGVREPAQRRALGGASGRPASRGPGRGGRRSRPGRSGARRSRSRRRRRAPSETTGVPACTWSPRRSAITLDVLAAAARDRAPLGRVRDRQHAVVGEEADQVPGREVADGGRRRRPHRAGQRQHEVVGEVAASIRPGAGTRRASGRRPPGRRGRRGRGGGTGAPRRASAGSAAGPARRRWARRPACRARRRTRGRSPRSARRRTCRSAGCAIPSSANSRRSVG